MHWNKLLILRKAFVLAYALNAPERSGSSPWWLLVTLESLLFPQEFR